MLMTDHPCELNFSGLQVEDMLSRFSLSRLLVIGDLMLDRYIWGAVNRISPEAPVQVLEVTHETDALGGAGNVAKNLVSFAQTVFVIGVLGADAAGARIRQCFEDLGVDTRDLVEDETRVTTQKTRIIAGNHQMMRVDRELRLPLSPGLASDVIERARGIIDSMDAVLLSDYGKGMFSKDVLRELIQLAASKRKPIVVDPKGVDYKRYAGATIITPNRKEASLASGVDIDDDEDSLKEAVNRLRRELDSTHILVTLGAKGMALFTSDGKQVHIPATAREVYDVSGAGDTVISFLGLGISSGFSLERSAALANAAAGIVVGKVGTATLTPQELREALLGSRDPLTRKIREVGGLIQEVQELKRRGKTVVFTNGCFDLLHAGHIRLLEASKRLGDVLIVAVDDDESIQKLKGDGRPILKQDERLRILAALDSVDFLCLFSSPDLKELLDQLKPDVLTKGANYSHSQIRGREVVERHGGRVVAIPLEPVASISGLIQRIRQNG
ncbi:MAG: D-glycero-beta-D-manno-heptose-7-phosphate kinase [Deltaproteobacteria bacterium]|nr:D-glycero-beta-D-manno-heptose-7-phosphate kinase [Deltaproteobacteria bacterium]